MWKSLSDLTHIYHNHNKIEVCEHSSKVAKVCAAHAGRRGL